METTIVLTPDESRSLQALAAETGKTTDQLVHEAVKRLIGKPSTAEMLARVPGANGMWRDRDDLPDLRELRAEFDRTFE